MERVLAATAGGLFGLRGDPVIGATSDAAIAGCLTPTQPEAWNRFRGPNGSGVAEGTGFPGQIELPRSRAWRTPIPRGHSSPILTRDHVFLTGFDKDRLLVIAVNRADGEVLWTRGVSATRREKMNPRNTPATPSAATDGKNVVAFFGNYGLVSYDARGHKRWERPLGPFSATMGISSSPVIAGKAVVLLVEGFADSYLTAFHKDTGHQLWLSRRKPFSMNYATPVLREGAAGCEILVRGPREIVGYSLATGEQVWRRDVPGSNIVASPALDDGRIVSMSAAVEEPPSFSDPLKQYDKDGSGALEWSEFGEDDSETGLVLQQLARHFGDRDGTITASEWSAFWQMHTGATTISSSALPGQPGGEDPAKTWTFTRGVPRVPTPLVYRGLVYMVNSGGILTTLNAATGELVKQQRLTGALEQYFASPVAADGKVYLLSDAGKLVVVQAGPDAEQLSLTDLGEESFSTPALSQGQLYVRTQEAIWCLGDGTTMKLAAHWN